MTTTCDGILLKCLTISGKLMIHYVIFLCKSNSYHFRYYHNVLSILVSAIVVCIAPYHVWHHFASPYITQHIEDLSSLQPKNDGQNKGTIKLPEEDLKALVKSFLHSYKKFNFLYKFAKGIEMFCLASCCFTFYLLFVFMDERLFRIGYNSFFTKEQMSNGTDYVFSRTAHCRSYTYGSNNHLESMTHSCTLNLSATYEFWLPIIWFALSIGILSQLFYQIFHLFTFACGQDKRYVKCI